MEKTLRDDIAIEAMKIIISKDKEFRIEFILNNNELAIASYGYADAMIEERNKNVTEENKNEDIFYTEIKNSNPIAPCANTNETVRPNFTFSI